jgi:O-antigen/teichoic acid export membrane protein
VSVTEAQQPNDGEEIEEFKGRATSGAAWVGLGHGTQQGLRLLSNLILTRLLFEEHFGLMALVGVIIMGIHLFSDIGIGAALIQNEREDPGFVDTMWTMDVIRGFVLWLVAFAVAGPAGAFYGEPILVDLIRVSALNAIVEGFRSTNFRIANRNLHMRAVVMLEVGSQIAGIVVMVTWASIVPTVWSLVGGGLTTAVVSTIWTWTLPGRRNRFHFERRAARTLYHFGRWILLSTLLHFLASNMDRIVFGRLVTMAVLGVYNIALNLAVVPSIMISHLSFGVMFPLYSRFYQKGSPMLPIYRNARLPLMVIGGWATAGVVAGGPTIMELLYDPRYSEGGWMLQVLTAGLWFGVGLESSNKVALIALGQTRWTAISGASKVAGMAALLPLGWHFGGFPGAMLGLAVSDVVRYLVSTVGVLRFGLDGRVQDLKVTLLVAASAFAAWLTVQLLIQAGWTNVVFHAFVIAVIVTAIWAPQHLQLWRRYRDTGHLFFDEPG